MDRETKEMMEYESYKRLKEKYEKPSRPPRFEVYIREETIRGIGDGAIYDEAYEEAEFRRR